MSESRDPALIGRRIAGKFLVEKLLGGGAMGAVYRARDTTLERLVALKVMHPAVAVDPSFVNRFHREARAASRLDHPSSMRVIEFGEEPDGLLYIAMEYLEGRDLYKVIHEDWPLAEDRIADMMMKALSALTMAHEMGVIHRDLKPENIMILDRKDDEGRDIVKVCDFGIAKITEKDDEDPDGPPRTAGQKLTTAGLVVGTPEYMSPEQARGEKLDARSDLYSMGIILYQLLTGRTPFLADTALAVVLKHISEAPEPPNVIYPGVHKGLEEVCLRALAKPRERRFQSAREMRNAVKAAIEGRPMPVESTSPTAADPAPGNMPSAPLPRASTMPMRAASAIPSGTSAVTPLGTSLVSGPESRSRGPMIAVGLLALVAGVTFVVLFFPELRHGVAGQPVVPADTHSEIRPPVSSVPPAPPTATVPPSRVTPQVSVSAFPSEAPPRSRHGTAPATKTPSVPPPTAEAAPVPPPPMPPPPPEEPAPTHVTPPPAPPPPAPAPAPAFKAASCRAAIGNVTKASTYRVTDLQLRGTEAAWTSCAKSTFKERTQLSTVVHLHFVERSVRSATCPACPRELATCIDKVTRSTAAMNVRPSDQTGEPEYDVSVAFTCD